ncbi:hypothetical protein FRC12_023278 [Ceratobasidium sp. 428]|nr:hypothetical protein FRC12_023278 [Ceratobasidium sp. 428]
MDKLVVAACFKNTERKMDKDTKTSEVWKTFKNKFNVMQTGANRLLETYGLIGTLLIFDPVFQP